ncbi:MAG: hypothetical protein ABW134_11660 [Candidatus Thiodiazotropha endolucinida]
MSEAQSTKESTLDYAEGLKTSLRNFEFRLRHEGLLNDQEIDEFRGLVSDGFNRVCNRYRNHQMVA